MKPYTFRSKPLHAGWDSARDWQVSPNGKNHIFNSFQDLGLRICASNPTYSFALSTLSNKHKEVRCRVGQYKEGESIGSPQELANRIFTTCYMGTVNSGSETKDRARKLAEQIGADHLDVKVDIVIDAMAKLFQIITGRTPKFRVNALHNLVSRTLTGHQLACHQCVSASEATHGIGRVCVHMCVLAVQTGDICLCMCLSARVTSVCGFVAAGCRREYCQCSSRA